MKNLCEIIIFSLFIISCNSKDTKSINQIEDIQIQDSIDENVIINNVSENSFEYIFKNPFIDDTVMYAYYENNVAINYEEPFNRLIYGRKTQSDGTILFYAHCPPFFKLETYIIIEDLSGNSLFQDTIVGEIVEVKTKPNQLITIAMGAFNDNGIANFIDEFTFYSRKYEDTEIQSKIFSPNYMKRNPDTKALPPFKKEYIDSIKSIPTEIEK